MNVNEMLTDSAVALTHPHLDAQEYVIRHALFCGCAMERLFLSYGVNGVDVDVRLWTHESAEHLRDSIVVGWTRIERTGPKLGFRVVMGVL